MSTAGINTNITTQKLTQPQTSQPQAPEKKASAKPAESQVTISNEAKELLAKQSKDQKPGIGKPEGQEDHDANKVESFVYGTLGLDHPDEVAAETDTSYTAGQYAKGALTIGALLLAIV